MPEQGELTIDAQQGAVFIELPSGKVMGISPEQAKSLGGDLLNFAREAAAQQKRAERQRRVVEKATQGE